MTIEEIAAKVYTVAPKPGDILVIEGSHDEEALARLRDHLGEAGFADILLLAMPHEDEIRLLTPKPGDVLIVLGYADEGAVGAMAAVFAKRYPDVPFVFVGGDTYLETVDEETMRAQGWIRAPRQQEAP